MLRRTLLPALVALTLVCAGLAGDDPAAAFDQQLAGLAKSGKVTVIHLWAPWCGNCKSELSDGKWSRFISENPDVTFVFVTVWNPADGRAVLEKNGVGPQANFQLLLHPNGSRRKGEQMKELLGMRVSWIPTTWVYKDGGLRYALNYGELRFPMLKQMIDDSRDSWDH